MTIGIHWYRGVALGSSVEDVLSALSARWGDSVVVLERGQSGYRDGYLVGHGRIYAHPERPDMGVMLELTGEACESLGGLEVARVADLLELRAARLDLAVDHCPFTPAMVREAWHAGDVRSRSKIPDDARPDRQWRKCDWSERPSGDMFTMGSRQSSQYGRCYDRRGFTRFELELKHEAASIAAAELLQLVLEDQADGFGLEVVGWVRRFVDFVDRDSSAHASRCELLPWWAGFVAAASIARVTLAAGMARTIEQVRGWIEHQVAPSLGLVLEVLGAAEVLRMARAGQRRWGARHRSVLAGVALASG